MAAFIEPPDGDDFEHYADEERAGRCQNDGDHKLPVTTARVAAK
jgi:hypothetical protein